MKLGATAGCWVARRFVSSSACPALVFLGQTASLYKRLPSCFFPCHTHSVFSIQYWWSWGRHFGRGEEELDRQLPPSVFCFCARMWHADPSVITRFCRASRTAVIACDR